MHLKHADTRILLALGGGLAAICAVGAWLIGPYVLAIALPLATMAVAGIVMDRHRDLVALQERQRVQVQAMLDLHALLRIRAPLPPMASWACTPELALAVVRAHLAHRPRLVVEAGSGVSSLVNGYALERADVPGTTPEIGVLSLDHDVAFAEITRQHLREHGLAERVAVVDAPLVPHTIRGETWLWYDVSKLPPSAPIDLVLVDGPPMTTQPLARYPALPLLVDRLADEAVIILDDAARPSERAAVERWLAEYPGQLTHTYFNTLKGTSVLLWRRRAG